MIENLLARLRDSHFGPDPVTEKALLPLSENFNGRKGF